MREAASLVDGIRLHFDKIAWNRKRAGDAIKYFFASSFSENVASGITNQKLRNMYNIEALSAGNETIANIGETQVL